MSVLVHQAHCCMIHGCKYGETTCPVELGYVKQDFPCEDCSPVRCDHSKTHALRLWENAKPKVWYAARWALCYEQDCDGQPYDACVEKAEKVLKEADEWDRRK